MKLPTCKGCEQRQEAMRQAFNSMVDWVKSVNRSGPPPIEQMKKVVEPESERAKKN